MQAIEDFFGWLFGTRTGVVALVLGGIVLCLLIAVVMERKTKTTYFNHEKSDDDWSLFDDLTRLRAGPADLARGVSRGRAS